MTRADIHACVWLFLAGAFFFTVAYIEAGGA